MNRPTRLILLGLLLLMTACASTPKQPAAIERYDRDMQKAGEYFQEGRMREAAVKYRLAANRALQFDDPSRIAMAELGLGAVSIEMRELEQARFHYRSADTESRRSGHNDLSAQAVLGIAEVARLEGDCESALAEVVPLREAPDRTLRLGAQLLTAYCFRFMGDTSSAKRLLDDLGGEIETAPVALQSAWHAARAADHLEAGTLDAALAEAEKALAIDRERLYPPAIAANHRLLAEIHQAAKRDAKFRYHRQRAEQISNLSGLSSTPTSLGR